MEISFVVRKSGEKIKLVPEGDVSLSQHLKNCSLISKYLISTIEKLNIDELDVEEFAEINRIVDEHYVYVKTVTRMGGVSKDKVKKLRAETLVLKLGAKIPAKWMCANENSTFWLFIVRNYFQHDFFSLRLQLPFDYAQGPSIPVYHEGIGLVWVPFNRIKIQKNIKEGKFIYSIEGNELFDSDTSYVLGSEYCCFYNGVQKYNVHIDTKWLPYDKRNPIEWDKKYLCEIWVMSIREKNGSPSYFRKTHAYLKLLDRDGLIRAVGQDILIDVKNYKLLEVLSAKPGYGKITTPDKSVFYPMNSRKFWHATIEITKEEHDKIIAIVEDDKVNRNHTMSVMKRNCVSYVLKLLHKGLGLHVNASFKWYSSLLWKCDATKVVCKIHETV